jgi:hypothetical protein
MVWREISVLGMAATVVASVIVAHVWRDDQSRLPQSTLLVSASDNPSGGKCLSERVPLILAPNHHPFLNIRVGERQGWFLLDTGTNVSMVDFHAYDFPGPEGTRRISGSSLPTLKTAFFSLRDFSFVKGPSEEPMIGLIGADVLGSRTVEIHFDAEEPFITVSDERCPPSVFEERGLRAIDQKGYFTSHWFWKWWALWRGGNFPVAFVRIGGTVAPAMIDSGSVQQLDKSVDVNEALFEHLRKEGVAMQSAGTTSFTDCTGKERTAALWTVADAPLSFTTEAGEVIRTFGPPILEVKPAARPECGRGIGNWNEPWAQIGMMQLLWLGAVVIDGANEKVWLPQQRAAASPVPPFLAISLALTASGVGSLNSGLRADEADATALKHCNDTKNQGDTCQIATSIKPDGFGCLALARNSKALKPRSFSVATAASWTAARDTAIRQCKSAPDAECELVHAVCNG